MTIPISDTIVPGGTGFGIIKDSDQVGGYAVETSEATIGAIASGRLRVGMQRFSTATGITYGLSNLTPTGGFANGTWTPTQIPGDGSVFLPGADTVATTNISLSTEQTINGVNTDLSRVLVVGQSAAATNGIYTSSPGAWTRTADADIAADFGIGKSCSVVAGTLAGTIYVGTSSPSTINVDPILFVSNAAGGSVVLGGDLAGGSGSATVIGLQGIGIAAGTPSSNQALTYNSGTSKWTATTLPPATVTGTGVFYAASGALHSAAVSLTGDVSASALSGSNLPITVGAIQGQTVTSGALTKGNLLVATTTSNWASTAVTGDVQLSTATPGASTVVALQGIGVATGTPSSNQVLTYNSGTSKWTATTPPAASVTGTGLFYSASGTLNSAAVSLSGDVTAAALSGSNVPITVGKIQGNTITSGALAAGQLLLATTTTNWAPITISGDSSITSAGAMTNAKVNGTTVPAGGSLTTGNQLIVTGASALGYAALNLAGGSGFVSGQLPVANLANGTAGQTLVTNSGATAPAWITVSGDTTLTAAGVAAVVSITGPSGGGGTVPMTFLEADWSPVSSMTVKTLAASVQTTNATLTTIATIATASGKTYAVQAQLSTQLSGGDWLSNSYTCYFDNNAGTTTIRGNVIGTAGGTTSGLAWPGLSFALSGTSVLAQVTGAASTTITWKVALTIQVSG